MGSTVASEVAARVGSYLRWRLDLSLASAFASREFKLEDSKLGVLVSPTAAVPTIISMLVPRILSRLSSTVASKLNSRLSSALSTTLSGLDLEFGSSMGSVLHSRLNPALESVLISLPNIMDGSFGSWVYSSSRFCDSLAQKLFEELDVELKSRLNMILSDPVGDTTIDQVIELDRLMLQAEKKSLLSDVLGRMRIEILPTLSTIGKRLSIWNPDGVHLRSVDDQVRFLEDALALYNSLAGESGSGLDLATSVLVSAIILSVVYQYLIGYVDKGGTKTYNSGSLEFRATYVSLMLFQGAYVWIKFRDVASRKVSRRFKENASGERIPVGKWLSKFKPPREGGQSFNCLELAGYGTKREAEVAWQMAAFHYNKDERRVQLEDGFCFDIPLTPEQDLHRRGEDKRKWVTKRVKEVFKDFKRTHDQWRESERIKSGDVELTAKQGVDSANDLSDDHTLPQCTLDSGASLIAAPTGIYGLGAPVSNFFFLEDPQSLGTPNCQGEPNAQLSSILDNVESVAIGNHQPLADVLTPAFERTVDDLISRGTEEDYVRVGNKLVEMHNRLTELLSVQLEKDEEWNAGSVNIQQGCDTERIQHQFPALANQVHDPSLHNRIVPQSLCDVSDILDALQEQHTITTQVDPFTHEFGQPVRAGGGIEYEALFASTEDAASSLHPTFCTFPAI